MQFGSLVFLVRSRRSRSRVLRWNLLAWLTLTACSVGLEPHSPRQEDNQPHDDTPPGDAKSASTAGSTASPAVNLPGATESEPPGPETSQQATAPSSASRLPPAVRLSEEHQRRIDQAVSEALEQGKAPGCVVALGRRDGLIFLRAYGQKSLQPEQTPMTTDTVFDLASLTKPVATATSIMILAERGRVDVRQPVARYLPLFGRRGKDRVTVAQLLTHSGGLRGANGLSRYVDDRAESIRRILTISPLARPGQRFIYSDLGFIVLGELVERVSGENLSAFATENIFRPLGLQETRFQPDAPLARRAAPTTQRNGDWNRGEVHDPRAYRLGGIAGNAGLFSTAHDLARFARMMLGRGSFEGTQVLSPRTVSRITASQKLPGSVVRTFGWDRRSGYSSARAPEFSDQAYGHGGYTGTSLWIDPELDLFVLLLSNRVHPSGRGAVNELARAIGSVAAEAVTAASPPPARQVLLGIDVLRRDGFRTLQGAGVGLITNASGRARDGVPTRQLLAEAPGVELVTLFSPEHGLDANQEGRVSHGTDPLTSLPVHSLFGRRRRPSAESLQGIDTLVFDIQDVGGRFYTYVSTMVRPPCRSPPNKIFASWSSTVPIPWAANWWRALPSTAKPTRSSTTRASPSSMA